MPYLCRQREGAEVQLQPFRNPALEGSGRSAPRSSHFPPGKEPVTTAQEAGWASVMVSTERETSPSPRFDPRTVQPVASGYTH